MKFFYHPARPDQKHRGGAFTRSITAFTLEDPREPGRPAFVNLALRMTYDNQSTDLIKTALEEKTNQQIELVGGYTF